MGGLNSSGLQEKLSSLRDKLEEGTRYVAAAFQILIVKI
jgi:hypothetical protein